MKIKKYTLKADKSEIWVVYEDGDDGEYIGTLHSKNLRFIEEIIGTRQE